MNETIFSLIGVVIGGLIGIIGQFGISFFDNKRWEKEKRIEHLRIKRSELDTKYKECMESLYESLKSNTYSTASVFDAIYFFPVDVKEAYRNVKEDGDIEVRKKSVWNVEAEMKKSLAEIDKQIDDEIIRKNIRILKWNF